MNSFKNLLKYAGLFLLIGMLGLTACKDDEEEDPPVVILDGIYVTGGSSAYSGLDSKAMMKVTRNEVTQTDRASLYELYIPLKAGSAGISIVKVAGSMQTTYGPGADWAVVTNPTTDEPQVDFQRGSFTTTTAKFTVPADGMYHVMLDMDLMKAAIVPVHWGIIGGATALGWGGSTDLNESAFNLTTMSWTLTDVVLMGGEWKFRYSDGWKLVLDTALDLGGGKKGVKVNTNFGGTVAALIPGGDNIVNATPGKYTITLSYTLGTGYKATVTKTGDIPKTDWTGVQCDAVGTGISIDNAASIPDPSSWNWGRVLVANNGGVPTKTGDVYTWTWDPIVLEANEGFKVRTLNGVAPPVGGANFDAGYSALDVTASSNKVVDMGGNLSVNAKGSFKIVLTIDAADSDKKKIVITE